MTTKSRGPLLSLTPVLQALRRAQNGLTGSHEMCALLDEQLDLLERTVKAQDAELDRAATIINWMAPYIGSMCTPRDGIAELNEHWIFMQQRAHCQLLLDRMNEKLETGLLETRPG